MAEHDLRILLKTLTVKRHDGVWTFAIQDRPENADAAIMVFRETEGWTLILPAEDTTQADNRWAWLELSVFSDLNAVGFLAAAAKALADVGVPCNAVAAFHHDHIFVPEHMAETAIAALEALSSQS